MNDLTGTTLGGRYDLLERLGSGGMGTVYRARDRDLDEQVALKVIRDDLARDPLVVARFRREVKLARRVTHVNVARTFELGNANGHVFCTMELVEGESLTARMSRDRILRVGEAVSIASAVCDGLAVAHAAGVIHPDIKPDNILLANDGRVVVADFGVAAVHTGEGELSGTPAYMAPEQARGERPSPAGDVYAVGVVLYEMITGRRAFPGEPLKVLADKELLPRLQPTEQEAPPELAAVIGRATARDRAERPADARALHHELEPWAKAPRRETAHPRDHAERGESATVIVHAPRGESPHMYLAEAIYDELLVRLVREPRLRVLSRADAVLPGALVVRLTAGELLTVRAERDGAEVVGVEVPLVVSEVDRSAEVIYKTVCDVGRAGRAREARELEAYELTLQSRHLMRHSPRNGPVAIERAVRAQQLCPQDPRVLATLAIVTVRHAFFSFDAPADVLARGAEYARAAVAAAPELVDSHLALGHVELNSGNPVAAASHYRTAISRGPHSAEAHEYMGRMLLEAGHLDAAFGRLDEAMAIMPSRRFLVWEIARAHALEGRWDDAERAMDEMERADIPRPFARARIGTWRQDPGQPGDYVPGLEQMMDAFAPGLNQLLLRVYREEPWAQVREQVIGIAKIPTPNVRRKTLVAQVAAEAAGWAGDHDAAAHLIGFGTGAGLFDLHWLDKCPLLAGVRAMPGFKQLRAPIKRRADAILDAMYGDHDVGTIETIIATT